MNEPNKREEEQFIEEAMDDLDVQFWEISSEKDQRKVWSNIKEKIAAAIEYGKEEGRSEYRSHLCFVYRWISRLNGDKSHDTPEKSWRTYVSVLVNYPLSPWQTGDWFEDDVLPPDNQS